jgi:hypothetical protein
MHEGFTEEEAQEFLRSATLDLRPNQDCGRAAPLAGVVTSSMPLLEVEDPSTGTRAYAPLNEGLGAVLRFGATGPEVLARLGWIRDVAAPLLHAALEEHGPLALRPILAGGLLQGDELHNRNVTTTAAMTRELAPEIAAMGGAEAALLLGFMRGNDHFFLNVAVAAAKCLIDAAFDAAPAGVVTAMGANGQRFGIKVRGLGETWITAESPHVLGRLDTGRHRDDASPLLGDSCIIEAAGFGGMVLHLAPRIAEYLGVTPGELERRSAAGRACCLARHRSLDAPLAIDVRKARASSVLPVIDAGVASRHAGVGQIGAGLAEVPRACFSAAADALETATTP